MILGKSKDIKKIFENLYNSGILESFIQCEVNSIMNLGYHNKQKFFEIKNCFQIIISKTIMNPERGVFKL